MQHLLNPSDPVSKNGSCGFSDTGLPAGSVCLFAAFAPDGILPIFTRFYLKNILDCGFILHLVLSGETPIDKETIVFCKKNNIHVWQRPNGGMDFGAWRFLFQKNVAAQAPYVLLANDSVFGPFRPLADVVKQAHAYTLPAWGLVASRLITPHLQSWFVGLSRHTLQAAPVQRVFSLPFEQMSRNEIIWHGELGLSVALQEAGVPLQAAWSDLQSPLARFLPTNPMHTHTGILLLLLGRCLLSSENSYSTTALPSRTCSNGRKLFHQPVGLTHNGLQTAFAKTNPDQRQLPQQQKAARFITLSAGQIAYAGK